MAQVEKKEMLRLLDSLKRLTLDAYDGKLRSRGDIEAQYRIIMEAVMAWDDTKEKGA